MLVAALEVLAERGLAGFNMEAIARRADASKATIYRRWKSPGELLIDAMDASFRPLPMPTTGHLRSDLIEILSGFERLLDGSSFPRLMAAFIDAAERDPRLKSQHAGLTEQRREPLRTLLLRARDRGELPAATDIELAVDLLGGPLFYRRFIAHRVSTVDDVTALVDHVLSALGAVTTGSSPPLGAPALAVRRSG
ncbi:MAG: TetR/AcrR family transcriptional regulator [Candidatus Dormibacteria bacterium]